MINQQLLTYISSQQEAGIDDETIKDNLQSAGWREEDIDEGFQAVANDLDGGNSTAAHQQIREEASKQRGGQGATQQGVDDQNQGEADQSSDDSYREPIEEEDTSGPAAASGDSSLSPIDEETSDNNAGQSRELGQSSPREAAGGPDQEPDDETTDTSEDESGQSDNVDADTESGTDQPESVGDTQPEEAGEAKEAGATSGPEDIDDSGSSNPLESHEKMKEIGAQSGDSGHDTEPVAVRTFQSDSQKAGGDEGQTAEVDHPATRKKPAADTQSADEDSGEPETAAASVAASSSASKNQEKERDKPESGSPKAGAEVKQDTGGPQQRKRDQKPATSKPTMDTVSDKKASRDTTDGKRRFAASKDPSAVKRRAAKRGSSSSSSWLSILLFIFALVLVGGGGAYAYMTFFQTSSPEVTTEEAMRSLAEAGSFNFRTMIESADGDSASGRAVIEGAVDLDQNTDAQSYYTITSEDQEMPIQAIMAETENMATVPAIQRETVRDILFTPEFLSIGSFQTQERLGQTSDSDGFLTNRFSVSLNSSQLVSDYATLHQALFDNALSQEVLSNLQATVSQFEPTQGQAWLDAETNVPYQITFIGTGPEGQDMQVNLQFKNHGTAIETTPSYEPRSGEQVLSDFFSTDSSEESEISEESDDATTTSDDATTTPDETSSEEETAEEDQEPEIADSQLRRWDRLRLNDLQQIAIALRVYGNENDSYPDNLQALLSEDDPLITEVPRDPVSSNAYPYSISEDGTRYHIGATLQILTRSSTSGDANFNSRGQGFPNGFNGAAASCQSSSAIDPVSTCYDLSGSLE